MKRLLFLIISVFVNYQSINAQIIFSNDTSVCNSYQDTLYALSTIQSSMSVDDQHDALVPIGFSFNFYGISYTSLVVSGNGYVTFNASQANSYSPWSINQAIPNPGSMPENAIMAPWQDINTAAGGAVYYGTIGIAPNRMFVVTWCSVPMYSCSSDLYTGQVVLYEGSDKIEMHLKDKPLCSGWNGGNGIHGLVDATSANWDIVTDPTSSIPRNFGLQWAALNEGWEFLPNTPANSYTINSITYIPVVAGLNTWTDANGNILGTGPALPVNISSSAIYFANISGSCFSGILSDSININFNGGISLTANNIDVSCNGISDGSINLNVSGGSPYTYLWSNGAITSSINNLSVGSYSVTVTDGCGGTAFLNNIIISEPQALQATSLTANVSCNGISDGSINLNVLGGVGPYTYLWSSGAITSSINNLSVGSYNVTVTDYFGCSLDLNNIIISEPQALQANSLTNNVSCNGLSDGGADLNILGGVGPYTYLWSNGAITSSINNLIAGTYGFTITDYNGCSFSDSATVYEPNPLVVILNTTDETCFGYSDGTATIDLQGSSTPLGTISTLSYCSSHPDPDFIFQPATSIEEVLLIGDNVNINNNTIGIMDYYEDYTSIMYSDITEGQVYSIIITLQDLSGSSSYLGGARVFIDFNIDGDFLDLGEDIGIVPTPSNSGLSVAISFTVPVTGVFGATRMRVVCQDQFNITNSNDIDPCDAPLTGTNGTPWFGATEDYSIVLNNPNVNATYLWSTGQITDSISSLSTGIYSLNITDMNGCLITENFTISSGVQVTVLAASDQSLCIGLIPNSLLSLGSTSGNNYSWFPTSDFINSNIQNPVFSNALITTTAYTVTFTDFNGCVATDSITITVFPTLNTDPINHN